MKMILIITNKTDVTVDFIVQELKRQKCQYYRFNTEDIPLNVVVNFNINEQCYELLDKNKGLTISLKDISAVYFRRPKVSELDYIIDIDRQERCYLRNELSTLLEGIYKSLRNVFWINNVYRIREAENKLYQLQLAQMVGFEIPLSVISNNSSTLQGIMEKCNDDCIIKPVRTGNLGFENNSKVIFTSKLERKDVEQNERVTSFPVFVQENIHKKCDIRCTVVGEEVFACKIDSQMYVESKIDWRKSSKTLPHTKTLLPEDINNKAVEITRRLGLSYAAIDLVENTNGDYIFLECNPNGQWAWIENRVGYKISKSLVDLLQREMI